jgi:hypothetical protein
MLAFRFCFSRPSHQSQPLLARSFRSSDSIRQQHTPELEDSLPVFNNGSMQPLVPIVDAARINAN